MSYRDDLEAAVRRAEAAERELERAREADRQKIAVLETKLEDARRALARREPPSVPAVRARAEWPVRTLAGLVLSVAGLVFASVIVNPGLFAVSVVVGVATIYDRGRLTAGRELLDRFFTQLRTGKYEMAHGMVHRVSRSPAGFARFCNQLEGLRLGLVQIRTDRFLRRGARTLGGVVQVNGALLPLAATIDRDHTTGEWQIARVEIGLTPPVLLAPEVPES